MRWERLSQVRPEEPSSWEDKGFLTFDLDWAPDEALELTLAILQQAGAAATWFVTHDTPFLGQLRALPEHELGLHPNFEYWLQQGYEENGRGAPEILERLRRLVPEAVSVRSHYLTQSTWLTRLFAQEGLTHEANLLLWLGSEIVARPFRHPISGTVQVPFAWEDDVSCLACPRIPARALLGRPGLRVWNFHPIHVWLNTSEWADYQHYKSSGVIRSSGWGARDELEALLQG